MRGGALAAGLALALLTGAGLAQEARLPLRSPILTLDQERLFTESAAGSAVLAKLEADTADLAAENRAIEAQLVAEERALTDERGTIAPEDFRAKAEAFDQKVVSIRREQDAKARALAQRRETDQQAFYRQALPLLAELVRERGAVAVLERGAVILSAEQVDITEDAIAMIDARIAPDTAKEDGEARAPAGSDAAPAPAAEAPAPDVPAPDVPGPDISAPNPPAGSGNGN